MARYVERNQYDWFGTIWRLGLMVVVVLLAVLVVYPWKGLPYTVILILFGLWVEVLLYSRTTGYVCANCHKAFQVPTTVNFFTQSAVGKNPDGTYFSYKNLTCPHCGKTTKARLVKRVGPRSAQGSGRMLK